MKHARLFFRSYRTETILFFAAVFLRITAFAVLSYFAATTGILTSNPEVRSYPVIGSDAGGYVKTAGVLFEERRFAFPGVAEPQSYLMPGYPAFLATVFALGGGVAAAVVIQILFSGFSAVLIYRIGKEIAPAVGSIAAWIYVFDPISIFYATTILTETLFVFLVLFSVYIFLRMFGSSWQWMALTGLLAGAAVYIRPNAIMVPIVFILLLAWWKEDFANSWKQVGIKAAALSIAFMAVVFPWMLRNKIHFDTWELTAVATIQWYWYNAPIYYAHTHGITHTQALEIFNERLMEINPHQSSDGTLRNTPYMRRVAFDYLREDPFGYAWFHTVKSIPFFLSDGLRDIARRMEIVGEQPDIGGAVLRGNTQEIIIFFKEHTKAAMLLIAGVAMWGIITAGMLMAVVFGRNNSPAARRAVYTGIGIVLVTMLIAAGPNANARYRLSISPFMFIAAAYGLWQLRKGVKYRTVSSHEQGLLEA